MSTRVFIIAALFFVRIIGEEAIDFYQKPISIITTPIGKDPQHFWKHQAVFRSVTNGLKLIGARYNCNPRLKRDLYPHVLVLCNDETALQMVRFKECGFIKKLFLGPNFAFDSSTCDCCDGWLVPSEWTKNDIGEMHPKMRDKIYLWKAGVDTAYWKPSLTEKKRKALIYNKYDSKNFVDSIHELLVLHGWEVEIIQYGNYNQSNYKAALETVAFAVFISQSESQGLALAEAWAMDVPTLVWENRGLVTFHHFYHSNSAPYLNSSVGLPWKNLIELNEILISLENELDKFSPRDWVLENMSDEISALQLLHLFSVDVAP